MKNYIITLLLLAFTASSWAQLNKYKYVIVPTKFDVFPEENSFQTSTLLKYLFTESGYNAVYSNDMPVDLFGDPCLGVTVDLEKETKLARSRITILMKDCNGTVVFRSIEGISKSKEYRDAYHEAIRESFVPIQNMEYEYVAAKQEEKTITVSYANDIKKVEEKKEVNMAESAAVIQVATPEEQTYKSYEPEPSEYTKAETAESVAEKAKEEKQLDKYQARPMSNGYELMDKDQLWLTLYETGSPDVYLARNENQNGMVYKKESKWYFEFYKDSELVKQEILIDFQ